MRRLASLVIAALAFAPVAGTAQATTPQPAPMVLPDARVPSAAQYDAKMEEVKSARLAARARMVGALTAAHQRLLAQIVSDLAIGPKPDSDAAAARLDAALSPSESHAIVSIQEAFNRELLSGSEMLIDPGPGSHSRSVSPPEQDAARILLRMTAFFMKTSARFTFPRSAGQQQGAAVTPPPHP
jgi:hypothetical protein